MEKLITLFGVLVETVGILIFIVCASFAIVGGMLYQFFFSPSRKKAPVPFIPPPVTEEVEKEAVAASDAVTMKPTDSSVDFFNDLAKR